MGKGKNPFSVLRARAQGHRCARVSGSKNKHDVTCMISANRDTVYREAVAGSHVTVAYQALASLVSNLCAAKALSSCSVNPASLSVFSWSRCKIQLSTLPRCLHKSVVHLVISKSSACGCSALQSLLFVNRLHVGACVGLYDGARILAPSRVSMGQEAFTQLLQYTFLPSSARKGEQQSLHTLQPLLGSHWFAAPCVKASTASSSAAWRRRARSSIISSMKEKPTR